MAPNGNRTERADISAISLADGRPEYLPEEGYPTSGKAAAVLTVSGKPKTAASVDFISVSACQTVGNMV